MIKSPKTKKFGELRHAVDANPARRARVEAIKKAYGAGEALQRLREQRKGSQAGVAGNLGVSQANVSRIEHEEDVYLSTVRSYVEALGGRLEIRAVFEEAEYPL
jgi:DNA-binding XRE family transcriptional regulator